MVRLAIAGLLVVPCGVAAGLPEPRVVNGVPQRPRRTARSRRIGRFS